MLRPQYSGSRWGQKNYCVQCENLVVFLQMMSEQSRKEIRLILALIYDKITAFKLLGNSYHQAFICKKMQDEILQALSTRGNSNQFGPQYITLDTVDSKILSLTFVQRLMIVCLISDIKNHEQWNSWISNSLSYLFNAKVGRAKKRKLHGSFFVFPPCLHV